MQYTRILALITVCTLNYPVTVHAGMIGDANQDGYVTQHDGFHALRCAAGLDEDAACSQDADINDDGKITVSDAVSIFEYAVAIQNGPFRRSRIEPLPCGMYTNYASKKTFLELEPIAGFVMNYFVEWNGVKIFVQLLASRTDIKIIYPIYHEKGDSYETMRDRTIHKANLIQPFLEHVEAIYVWDEPCLSGVSPSQVEESVSLANEYFPGKPTLIFFNRDDCPRPPTLDYQGIGFYDYDPGVITEEYVKQRLDTVSALWGIPIIGTPRSWDDQGRCCGGALGDYNDEEIAFYTGIIYRVLDMHPMVVAMMPFIWDMHEKELPLARGARDLPLTRSVLSDLCLRD